MKRKHILLFLVLLIIFGTTILLFARRPMPVVENPQHSARLPINAANPAGTYVGVAGDQRTLTLTLKNDAKKTATLKEVVGTKPTQTKSGSWTVSPEKIITVTLPGQILKIVIEDDKLVLDEDGDTKTGDDKIILEQDDTKDQGTGGTNGTTSGTTGETKTGGDIPPPVKGGGGEPPLPAPQFDISGEYRLVSYNGKNLDREIPEDYTVSFSQGTLSAHFCNTLSGEYSVTPTLLMAPSLAATQMFCKDPAGLMDMEAAFGTLLARGATISSSLDELTLSGQGGNTFFFVRMIHNGGI